MRHDLKKINLGEKFYNTEIGYLIFGILLNAVGIFFVCFSYLGYRNGTWTEFGIVIPLLLMAPVSGIIMLALYFYSLSPCLIIWQNTICLKKNFRWHEIPFDDILTLRINFYINESRQYLKQGGEFILSTSYRKFLVKVKDLDRLKNVLPKDKKYIEGIIILSSAGSDSTSG